MEKCISRGLAALLLAACASGADDERQFVPPPDCRVPASPGCACTEPLACYTGPAGTASVGVCKAGLMSCVDGIWGACEGEVVPTGEVCDGLDNDCNGSIDEAWGLEVVDPHGGGHPDVGIDTDGVAHVAYGAADGSVVAYAIESAPEWTIDTAHDGEVGIGDISLALAPGGGAHVVFDTFAWGVWEVSPGGDDWTTVAVDAPTDGQRFLSSATIDGEGFLHASECDRVAADLLYATNASGEWRTQRVDMENARTSSIAVDAQGHAHIAYYERDATELRYATNRDGPWAIKRVAGEVTDAGHENAIAVDPQGVPHVLYHDTTTGELWHTWEGETRWERELVDGSAQDQGAELDVAVDGDGRLYVSYQGTFVDPTHPHVLRYATDVGGGWRTETIDDTSGETGFETSIAIADGIVRIVYSDRERGEIRMAQGSELDTIDNTCRASGQ